MTVQSTNGLIMISDVTVHRFAFGCGKTSIVLEGLGAGVEGMAELGRSGLSMAFLFSAAFRFPRKFALCLSSSTQGLIFFYRHLDTPHLHLLFTNPISTTNYSAADEISTEYFIAVKGIEVDGERVAINETMLSINKENGIEGTKLGTLVPYTTILYIKNTKEVNMATFTLVTLSTACFNLLAMIKINPGIEVLVSRMDPFLPNNTISCLGFVDGGLKSRNSIVISGLQLEENLLQLDISRLRFSSTLLFMPTSCSYFKSEFKAKLTIKIRSEICTVFIMQLWCDIFRR
ncbi:hypothetical protein MKW98_029423 [Papaver atlanticum]|uniref:Uncharacterized protein n=1 Tax=Papaver atlanticum TaxID=357466 RepID=A0AAD4SJL4_9MAGN|nr:hypothetical protein MKW98_029423 [Papaver atlanticum]